VRSCSDSPDFIVVRDGRDASSPVIAQYCNTQRSEQVLSSCRHLYIDFIVDGQRQGNGFEASYEFVGDSAGAAVDSTLDVDSPTLLQQSEGHHGTANEIFPSYNAGTRLLHHLRLQTYHTHCTNYKPDSQSFGAGLRPTIFRHKSYSPSILAPNGMPLLITRIGLLAAPAKLGRS